MCWLLFTQPVPPCIYPCLVSDLNPLSCPYRGKEYKTQITAVNSTNQIQGTRFSISFHLLRPSFFFSSFSSLSFVSPFFTYSSPFHPTQFFLFSIETLVVCHPSLSFPSLPFNKQLAPLPTPPSPLHHTHLRTHIHTLSSPLLLLPPTPPTPSTPQQPNTHTIPSKKRV